MKYEDIYVVDTLEEAEQFKYSDTGESVEVGTAVAYDAYHAHGSSKGVEIVLTCFEGIYFEPDGAAY